MKKILAVLVAMIPLLAMAHPGHGDHEEFTIIHYFTQPEHVVAILAFLLALVLLISLKREDLPQGNKKP